MSILNVEHLSHGFGDRAIFEDVSFRLLKGEHIGLVGALPPAQGRAHRSGGRQRRGQVHLYEHRHRQANARRGQGGVVQKRPRRLPRPARRAGAGHDHSGRAALGLFVAVRTGSAYE